MTVLFCVCVCVPMSYVWNKICETGMDHGLTKYESMPVDIILTWDGISKARHTVQLYALTPLNRQNNIDHFPLHTNTPARWCWLNSFKAWNTHFGTLIRCYGICIIFFRFVCVCVDSSTWLCPDLISEVIKTLIRFI